jgi:outer membrane biosynthesis protein TonB
MSTARLDLSIYQQPLWGTLDRVSRNCMIISAVFGVLFVTTVLVVPKPAPHEVTIEAMPERFAKLILEKPTPAPVAKAPQAKAAAPTPEAPQVAKNDTPKPAPVKPKARPVQRKQTPQVAQNKGQQGRQKAQTEVAQNLSQVSGSLDKVLGELSQALPAAGAADKPQSKARRRKGRGVRGGRAATQLAAVDNVDNLAAADIQGSALAEQGISIAAVTDLEVTGDGSGGGGSAIGTVGGSGSGGDEIRSNQTLLAVVRRYAPGIQFCYENELKKSPGLRGKLIVSLTVEPDGTVSNVLLVEDSLRSAAVTDCVTAQMRGWKFPAIESGTVTFKTPFVFTPPE